MRRRKSSSVRSAEQVFPLVPYSDEKMLSLCGTIGPRLLFVRRYDTATAGYWTKQWRNELNTDNGYDTLDQMRRIMTGATVGTSTTIPPFPILQAQVPAQTSLKTTVGVQITRVRNGYFVRTPEGEFVASSIDEITKLVAVAVAALELDR